MSSTDSPVFIPSNLRVVGGGVFDAPARGNRAVTSRLARKQLREWQRKPRKHIPPFEILVFIEQARLISGREDLTGPGFAIDVPNQPPARREVIEELAFHLSG